MLACATSLCESRFDITLTFHSQQIFAHSQRFERNFSVDIFYIVALCLRRGKLISFDSDEDVLIN